MSQVTFENTLQHTMMSVIYTVHLKPAIILKNYLPVTLTITIRDIRYTSYLEPGRQTVLINLRPGISSVIMSFDYLDKEWSCMYGIQEDPPEFSVWTFNSYVGPTIITLNLGMRTLQTNGTSVMMLYCPYWMINKTGLLLTYKKYGRFNVMHHPPFVKAPIMLSFNSDIFFGKKKISVRLEDGEWSKQFSIDVAGCSGAIDCRKNGILHQVRVNNTLAFTGLTKKIVFTPVFLIINHSQVLMECHEEANPKEWIKIKPKSCSGLWPNQEKEKLIFQIRIGGTLESTTPFALTDSRPVLLKVDNQYGGIFVDVQVSQGLVSINLSLYYKGMAPAIIVNDTNDSMIFWEKNSDVMIKLPAKQNKLFTWENPSSHRILAWEDSNKKEIENDLRSDSIYFYKVKENEVVYWASFLDGMQRVLLFSNEEKKIQNAQASIELEPADLDVAVSIHSIGVSLVNNWKRQEIMYLSITSSGVIWESRKEPLKKFRPISTKNNQSLENSYQSYLLSKGDIEDLNIINPVKVDEHTEVNFDLMFMLKPHKSQLRRKSDPGLWLNMKTSEHQMQLHVKFNKLQIDNQLYDCAFPVIFALVPPLKSVSPDQQIKPFLELSIMEVLNKNSQVKQFKYFKVLIQEFHIKIDLGFVNALTEILDSLKSPEENEEEQKKKFYADYLMIVEPLYNHIHTHSLKEQKCFFDYLHLSPLKIHLSFSMSARPGEIPLSRLNAFLQGIGQTISDLIDVVLKLDFFEKEYCFLTQSEFVKEATTHYKSQIIKQLHVIVLGLDVLSDSYTVMIRFSIGIKNLFYEPYQGEIEGPNEFSGGLMSGVGGCIRRAVGGTALVMSRITGAVGTSLSALAMDEKDQKKRRALMRKKPDTFKEGLQRGGKSLAMGVAVGVSGMIKKPIAGAKERGVGGFFTGLGKGTVGLLTRPTAGLMDFTSAVFETIARITDHRKEFTARIRARRFFHGDRHVRPYNVNLAEGNKLMSEVEQGKYLNDIYSEHIILERQREILLFTDNRLIFLVYHESQKWETRWMYTWSEMNKDPEVVARGIEIYVGLKKKTCTSNDIGILLIVEDSTLSELIAAKIIEHKRMQFLSS